MIYSQKAMAKLRQANNPKLRASLLFSIGLFVGLFTGIAIERRTGKSYIHHNRTKYLLGHDRSNLIETGQMKTDSQAGKE